MPVMTPQISASMLASNFAVMGEEVKALEKAGVDRLHWDVMDGHFVPNITFGPQVLKALRPYSKLPYEVHLMITPLEIFIPLFIEAGADTIIIHPEADPHVHKHLQYIRKCNKKAGIALNPGTPWLVVEPLIDLLDVILIMTVNPGFGGQQFIASPCEKIVQIKEYCNQQHKPIELQVDGGINVQTAPQVIKAGASVLIAGTAIFSDPDYAKQINMLRAV